MQIDGTEYKFRPFPTTIIRPAIQWTVDSAGYYHGSDRGIAQDIYETTLTFSRVEADINALQAALNSNRETMVLSSFNSTGQEIFGPEVNYSGSINATVINYDKIDHIHFNKIASTNVTFRALAVTYLSTTPSLSSLRLDEGWEGNQEFNIGKSFSLTQAASYGDHSGNLGRLVGTFTAKPSEAKAIMAYLNITARANTVALPTFLGVTYPFGYSRGTGPFNCKIPKWDVKRKDLNRWSFKIEFREAA